MHRRKPKHLRRDFDAATGTRVFRAAAESDAGRWTSCRTSSRTAARCASSRSSMCTRPSAWRSTLRGRFRGVDVVAMLSMVIPTRRGARLIRCDQGMEFTSIALDQWAYWNHVQLDLIRRVRPVDNAVCEALHGSVKREGLSQADLLSYVDARDTLKNWQDDYNNVRPQSNLQNLSPAPLPSPSAELRPHGALLRRTCHKPGDPSQLAAYSDRPAHKSRRPGTLRSTPSRSSATRSRRVQFPPSRPAPGSPWQAAERL